MTGQPGQQPQTVDAALHELADWLDEADKLIDQLAAARGMDRPNSGDAVQQDLRRLAGWFVDHPEPAAQAWAHVTGDQGSAVASAHCPTCICGRRAPVQQSYPQPAKGRGGKPYGTVSWAEHLKAYEDYSACYGTRQSAERLAERGGFCYWEITDHLGHEPTTWSVR